METGEAPLLLNVAVLLVAASILLAYGNNRWGSPIVAIVNRWLRWIVFAVGMALVSREFGWSERPFWVLATSAFLFWFLVETMFNWMAISALSRSEIPLFPRFRESSGGGEWPVQAKFIAMRDWLRERGFEKIQSLNSDLGIGIAIRSFVFQSRDKKTRIQVVFIPQRTGSVTECFSFHSISEDGIRFVTDNLHIPFGGFYPDHWRVARKTWIRGIQRLSNVHERRIRKAGATLAEWEEDPLDDLNDQQFVLERLNTELGFLYPREMREEYGKITSEGRYRVWKEIWLLNYFGKSCSG